MTITLGQLAEMVDGQLHGDSNLKITGASILRDAEPGQITLCQNSELLKKLQKSSASAVLLPAGLSCEQTSYITVDDVSAAFTRIVYHFRPPRQRRSIGHSPHAHVSRFAKLADDVQVHPGVTIADDVTVGSGTVIHAGAQILSGSRIGENVTIYPAVVLYENTVVGDGCILHAGAILGAYGFGYETCEGQHQLAPQLGYVELEANVDVGAGTTIDRGTYGPTLIGEGTKIDNQVQIAHNCRIGRHNLICSQVGIAGSSTTGDYVVLAGQVGVADHAQIGDQAIVGAKAGVSSSLPGGETYIGIPAQPARQVKLQVATLTKLPAMRKDLRQLQKEVQHLASQLSTQNREAA